MAADLAATLAEAERELVGRDGVVRDDPCFGRKGLIRGVLADPTHGYLVLVALYKPGTRYPLDRPGANGRRYWPPGRVQIG